MILGQAANQYEISMGSNKDSLKVYFPIGIGGTCEIYLGNFNGKKCAVKLIPSKQKFSGKDDYKSIKNNLYLESSVLKTLIHPHIVFGIHPASKGKLMESLKVIRSAHFILLELMEGGEPNMQCYKFVLV